MPQWASSVVPEGSLIRQLTNRDQEQQHQQIKSSINYYGTAGHTSIPQQQPQQQKSAPLPNGSNQLSSFARTMEDAMNLRQSSAHPNTNRTWDSASTNPVFVSNNNMQNQHQHHHFSTDFSNLQYSSDPVTQNMKSRALAANGTFGAKQQVIPTHIRSVVSTLRRNVDDMKRFAVEIPLLTTAEMPSATKRLTALLYAQTIAVDDLCRFTEDELKFASGKFFDLMSQMMELQFGKEDEDVLKGLVDEIILDEEKNRTLDENKNNSNLKHNNDAGEKKSGKEVIKMDSWSQTKNDDAFDDDKKHNNISLSETIYPDVAILNENSDEMIPASPSSPKDQIGVAYFAERSNNTSPRKMVLGSSPNNRKFLASLSLASSTFGSSLPRNRTNSPRTQQQQQQQIPSLLSLVNPTASYLAQNLGTAVSESIKELNAFRSLYSMLAGVANITGASEGRLFLFPSRDLLATSKELFQLHSEQDQRQRERNLAERKRQQKRSLELISGQRVIDDDGDNQNAQEEERRKQNGLEYDAFFAQADEAQSAEKLKNAKVMETLDHEKLYLVAQVQSTPFASVKTATAPRDVVRIAESVAETRCAANLTPGVARVRASFTSLIAVPLFVTKQPESAVLGVLVLTNKRLAQSNNNNSNAQRNQANEEKKSQTANEKHEQQQQQQPHPISEENTSPSNANLNPIVSRLTEFNTLNSHFDNSAASSSWITRGFFHDDEHKAVIAAEMMSWFVEKIPTGVVMRGAVRLTPCGFAQEWSNWASKPGNTFFSGGATASDGGAECNKQLQNPVLDPLMAMQQVPRRRFVFRTEDPREVAATGKLKLQSDRGFSQATTSSSGGGDLHANSRKAQAAAFARVTKTRSLISPETGEYLVDVAKSHRRMETKTDDLESEVLRLRRLVESVSNELDAERGLRRHAEDAAHSMQVACDRIVRKSILSNNHSGSTPVPSPPPPSSSQSKTARRNFENNNANTKKSTWNQIQQQQHENFSSDNNENESKAPQPSYFARANTGIFAQDLSDYATASRPYSKPNITIKGAKYYNTDDVDATNNNRTTSLERRPSSSASAIVDLHHQQHQPPAVPSAQPRSVTMTNLEAVPQEQQQNSTSNNNSFDENVLNQNHNSNNSGRLMSVSEILTASSVPFASQASKAVPSFHAPSPKVSEHEKASNQQKKNSKPIGPHDSHVMTRRVF